MKQFIIFSLLLLALISCNSDDEVAPTSATEVVKTEYDIALDLVKNFPNRVQQASTFATTRGLSDISVLNVKESSYSINLNEFVSKEFISKKPLPDEQTEVKLFTIEFEKNGRKGFSISSGDERITNIYAYTENGCLDDTTYNFGLKAALYDIKGACITDLLCYYEHGRNIRLDKDISIIPDFDPSMPLVDSDASTVITRASPITLPGRLLVNPITKLEWDQCAPFNQYVPVSCSGLSSYYGGKAPAGCVAVACAQVIAYLCPPAINYNLPGLRLISQFVPGNNTQSWSSNVGVFVRAVGTMVNITYNCAGSGAELKNIRDEFDSWSVYYSYASDANVDVGKLAYNAWTGFPHLTGGFNKSPRSGHAWVWEGVDCYVTAVNHSNRKYTISGSPLLYCNWGWGSGYWSGTSSNGWFASYEDATVNGALRRFIDDNEQIYINGTGFIVPPN